MWCKWFSSSVLFGTVLVCLPPSLTAAAAEEELLQPIATATAVEARVQESAPDASQTLKVSPKASDGIPTPAQRKPEQSVKTPDPQAPPAEIKPDSAAEPSDAQTADAPLSPIPDAFESGPISIEAASFKGVVPGVSKKEDVKKVWGQPKNSAQQNHTLVELYSVEPFDRVEVNYEGGVVASIVVRLDRSFPADAVSKQLDLVTIRPVLVSNEFGEVLGLAYPERGVLFAFEASNEPGKASMKVAQIVLEPVTAEPFVLRAETTLESRCDLCLRDLEQALALEPENARAHWLHSRVLAAMGEPAKAKTSAAAAVRIEPDNPRYRITHAQALAQLGQFSEAIDEAKKAVETSESRPYIKAQALCLLGDLLASGEKPDYKAALALHTQALQMADPLTSDPHPAIRLAAKEVFIDAHLGAAHDIAWGDWKEKNKAVARWLERAHAVAQEMVEHDGASSEKLFRVYVRAMAADVGIRGGINPQSTIEAAVEVGDPLIAAARDPSRKAQLQWDLGMALYDAVQIYQMRSDHDNALKWGEKAADYLAKANEVKQSPASAFLLGRLYFRLGTIHALRDKNHAEAVAWFDKAIPQFEGADPVDRGRHGETLVSMGVSYWETGKKKKAVQLTEKGIEWMTQAVEDGMLDRSALAVPYNNLAAMHRALGAAEKADQYREMASRVKEEKLK